MSIYDFSKKFELLCIKLKSDEIKCDAIKYNDMHIKIWNVKLFKPVGFDPNVDILSMNKDELIEYEKSLESIKLFIDRFRYYNEYDFHVNENSKYNFHI